METITFIIDGKVKRALQREALKRRLTMTEVLRRHAYFIAGKNYNTSKYKRGPK